MNEPKPLRWQKWSAPEGLFESTQRASVSITVLRAMKFLLHKSYLYCARVNEFSGCNNIWRNKISKAWFPIRWLLLRWLICSSIYFLSFRYFRAKENERHENKIRKKCKFDRKNVGSFIHSSWRSGQQKERREKTELLKSHGVKIRFEITRDNTEIDREQRETKVKKKNGITILFAAFVSRKGW